MAKPNNRTCPIVVCRGVNGVRVPNDLEINIQNCAVLNQTLYVNPRLCDCRSESRCDISPNCWSIIITLQSMTEREYHRVNPCLLLPVSFQRSLFPVRERPDITWHQTENFKREGAPLPPLHLLLLSPHPSFAPFLPAFHYVTLCLDGLWRESTLLSLSCGVLHKKMFNMCHWLARRGMVGGDRSFCGTF